MADSKSDVETNLADNKAVEHTAATEETQRSLDSLPGSETADQDEQEIENENYLEGQFEINEIRKRFDETSCSLEEKELSDLFKKGLLDDGSTGPLKGDFTLNDLPQLSGDEACSIQWMTSKRKPKEKMLAGIQKGAQGAGTGLSDDELASVLQACPDLEGFIAKMT